VFDTGRMRATAHHLSFSVRDLARSRAFYEDLLGLVPKARPDFGFPGAWYDAGACEVHLIEVGADFDGGRQPASLNPLAGHAAFAVESYGEAVTALRARGLEVMEGGPQLKQLWVRDPDGHIIELTARAA